MFGYCPIEKLETLTKLGVETALMKLRFVYIFPLVHFCIWLAVLLGSRTASKGFDLIGHMLAVLDFPASAAVMALAWVLPERVGIVAFGILGTLWWYYLGRKLDEWFAKRASTGL